MVVSNIHWGFGFRQNGGRENNTDVSIYYAGTEVMRTTAALTTMLQNVSMSGTLVVTGAQTFTGAAAFSADVTVASGAGLNVGSTSQATISDGDGSTNLIPEVQALGIGAAFAGGAVMAATFNTTNTRAVAPKIILLKGGAATQVATTALADNEVVGGVYGYGSDGTDFETPVGAIEFVVDDSGGPGTGAIGGSIEFSTTADGGETLTLALTINNVQDMLLLGGSAFQSSSSTEIAISVTNAAITVGTAGTLIAPYLATTGPAFTDTIGGNINGAIGVNDDTDEGPVFTLECRQAGSWLSVAVSGTNFPSSVPF
ncbi:MAG: hypothetical protein IIA44_02180, partial [Acidobacteria bacterium]|nr:hypothetical protein [Acidobacteriota bacterium]